MSEPELQIKKLSKSYLASAGSTAVHALSDVSLDMHRGDFVALHGASGSGKSTLLYTIAGLVTPDSGDVIFAGKNLTRLGAADRTRARAEDVGLVFQDFRLVPYLNVLENVTVLTGEKEKARELLGSMQLTDRMQHKPSQLSAGEQQRCAIARALIHQPQLLLADEPTGNLDAENSGIILKKLAEYAEQGNMVLMATHDPVAVSAASGSIAMADGEIIS